MYKDFVSTYITVSSTLLSIGVAIFTLATAFIVSKKEALANIERNINNDGISLTLIKKIDGAKAFLGVMRKTTNLSIKIIISSVFVFVFSVIFQFITIGLFIHLLLLPLIYSIFNTILCLIHIFAWYRKQ